MKISMSDICHDINHIYFDSTLMFTIHIINVINVKHSSKTSTLMSTFKTTLLMIFNSFLAIYYIIINAEVFAASLVIILYSCIITSCSYTFTL